MEHRPAGFFVLRTPLLPMACGFGERLEAALGDPAVGDAIEVASPSLSDALMRRRRDGDGSHGGKAERALARYATRSAARATPFGLFAGGSVGLLGDRTALELAPRESYVRRSRVSLGWATELADELARRPEVRAELTYRANPTLYRLPGRWRYVSRRREDKLLVHTTREIRDSPALRSAIECARDGLRLEEIEEVLLAAGDRGPEKVRAFLDRLVEGQLLVADLAPPVTGGEPADELIARLEQVPAAASTLAELRAARAALAELDEEGVGVAPERQREAVGSLARELPSPVSPVVTAELFKPAPGLSLGPRVLSEIDRGVELLRRWNAGYVVAPLEDFVMAFWRRYGDREVPLTEALDEDAGVGLDALSEWPSEAPPLAGERGRLVIEKLDRALRDGAREIEIGQDELDDSAVPLPKSFVVGGRIEAPSAAAVDRGDFTLWISEVYGPSVTGMLLPRLGVANERFRARLAEHAALEERLDPEAVHAEVVGLPQLVFGPIIHGPRLRRFEIEYPGLSGASADRRIAVDDLLVSVVTWRVMLRSRRTGQWVEPVLTSPLNLALRRPTLPPVFRFLALVGRQWAADLRWNWGPLTDAPFLPRVRSGRVVLALARWNLRAGQLEPLVQGSLRERSAKLLGLREQLGIPRLVGFVDGDNVLPVDLDTSAGVDTLLAQLKPRLHATLLEIYPDPAALCVEGPEGRFTHEFHIPYLAREPVRRPPLPRTAAPSAHRAFPPGSRWLDARFYAGTGTGDSLIRDRIAPLCTELVEEGVAERWFFIRYADPEPHIRVRMHGEPERLWQGALPLFNELAEGLIERHRSWRMTFDTYEPEIARYGGPAAIECAERWFCADSEAAAEALAAQRQARAEHDQRRQLALTATDAALRQLAPDHGTRLAMIRAARATLGRAVPDPRETVKPPSFAARYAARYRAERPALEAALQASRNGNTAAAPPGIEAYTRRAPQFEEIAAGLRDLAERDELTTPLQEVVLSLIHMRINRLLPLQKVATNIEPELRLYDALERLYASELARRSRRGARVG